MSNENTKDLTDSEKLDLLLAEMTEMRAWRGKVDAFIEDRSRDTQLMLAQIHKYMADLSEDSREIKSRLQRMDRRFETLAGDMVDLRNRQSDVEGRIDEAERRPS